MLWEDLPDRVRDAVVAHTGHITTATPVTGGVNSALTATLDTEQGRFFCKAVTADSRMAWMHRNELTVHPVLPDIAPALRWNVDQDGWLLLGFEHVTGHHPDLSPGSPDIAPTIEALHDLHAKLTPCPKIRVASFADHWRQLDVDPEALEMAEGDTLLHTDPHPLNFLIDTRVRVIDWAWARRGAPWVDDAFFATRLMIAGHTPEQAEQHTNPVPDEFVRVLHEVWELLAEKDPKPHRRRLAAVAERWARHRVA